MPREQKIFSLTVRIDEDLYTRFKMALIKNRTNIQNVLSDAIVAYVGEKTDEGA